MNKPAGWIEDLSSQIHTSKAMSTLYTPNLRAGEKSLALFTKY